MTPVRAGGLVAVALGPVGWCFMIGVVVGGDPLGAIEIGIGALVVLWAALVVRNLVQSGRFAAALTIGSDWVRLFGVPCRITPALGMDALVVGSIRPRIFLGAPLVRALTEDELAAVVYHEDHHRRTRAPLRAAALGAWMGLLGRSDGIRVVVLGRLADLESLADADAIRRGATPGSLARALLKGELSLQPVAFSYGAERRIEHLLDRAAGISITAPIALPYEWLPTAVLAIGTIGCHTGL